MIVNYFKKKIKKKLNPEHNFSISQNAYRLPFTQTQFTLSLNLWFLFRMPHTCAVENGGLNTSPESSVRTPPSHQTRLLRVRSSRFHGSRHRAPLSSINNPSILFIAFLRALTRELEPTSGIHRNSLSTQLNKIHSSSHEQYEVRLDDSFRDLLRA